MPSSAAKMAALHVAARGAPQTLPPVAQRLRSPRSGNAQDARCPSAARPEAAPYRRGRRLAWTLALPGGALLSAPIVFGLRAEDPAAFLGRAFVMEAKLNP